MRPVSVQVRRLMTKEEQEQFEQLWDIGKFLEQNQQFEFARTIQHHLDLISEAAVERMLRYEHRPNNKGMTAIDPEQAQVYVPQTKRYYLDYAATTPVRPEVREAMMSIYEEMHSNPSSSHTSGRLTRKRVEEAREEIAALLGAKPSEVIFTGSGTESDNMAILGFSNLLENTSKPLLFTSRLEHHAVLDTCLYLHNKYGSDLVFLENDSFGFVSPDGLREAIKQKNIPASNVPALVSIMLANNEIGTVQPIQELASICRENGIRMHTDAVQAIGKIPVNFGQLGVDMMSLTAHKFYGPKGIGALLIREGVTIAPLMHGGGQERALRPSTENVAGIVGLQVALRFAQQEVEAEAERLRVLRTRLLQQLTALPETKVNGHPEFHLPNTIHISFLGIDSQALLAKLDAMGVEVSAGSACDANGTRISHVLQGIGLAPEWARGSIRISMGREIDEQDAFLAGKRIVQAVNELRQVESR